SRRSPRVTGSPDEPTLRSSAEGPLPRGGATAPTTPARAEEPDAGSPRAEGSGEHGGRRRAQGRSYAGSGGRRPRGHHRPTTGGDQGPQVHRGIQAPRGHGDRSPGHPPG